MESCVINFLGVGGNANIWQADLQTQCTTFSTHTIRWNSKRGSMVGEPGAPNCWERHRKARLDFAQTHMNKTKSFWENVLCGKVRQIFRFKKNNKLLLLQNELWNFEENKTFLHHEIGRSPIWIFAMFHAVSEKLHFCRWAWKSCISVEGHGSCSSTKTQNKKTPWTG